MYIQTGVELRNNGHLYLLYFTTCCTVLKCKWLQTKYELKLFNGKIALVFLSM